MTTVFSDDAGATWKCGDIVVNHPDLKNPSETIPIELADGAVVLNIRNESRERRRAISFSSDGATGWSKPDFHDELYEPICMASIIRLSLASDGGRNRILYANPASDVLPKKVRGWQNRQNVSIKLSYNEGASWSVTKVLEPGHSGYTDLAVGPDGTVYCVYERGTASEKAGAMDPEAVTVARFNLEWVTDGEDALE